MSVRFLELSALSLPLLMSLSACIDSHGLAKNRPAHHTEDGFQNNYLPPERMTKSFSKLWRWSQNRIEQEPVQFELIEPDVDFLSENRTVPTLTWIGHSLRLYSDKEISVPAKLLWTTHRPLTLQNTSPFAACAPATRPHWQPTAGLN